MDWPIYYTEWISLVKGHHLLRRNLPLEFVTPELAWDYGAISFVLKCLTEAEGSLVLKVRAQAFEGRVGFSICKHDGSALVTREICLTPEQGECDLYLELPPREYLLTLLIRNYDDDGRKGRVRVQSVQALPLEQFDETLKAEVAAAVEI